MIHELADQDFELLLEIGHLAVDEGLLEDAETVFGALSDARPANPHPRIGRALVAHGRRQPILAMELLEALLREFPRAVFTRSLLARFMHEAGRSGWQRFASESLALAPTGVAADMARELLGETGVTSLGHVAASSASAPTLPAPTGAATNSPHSDAAMHSADAGRQLPRHARFA